MTALELARDAPAARPTIARMLAALIAPLSPGSYDAELETQLLACLGEPTLDPQPLAQTAAQLLLPKTNDVDADAATTAPLPQLFLQHCRNTPPPITPRIATSHPPALTHEQP